MKKLLITCVYLILSLVSFSQSDTAIKRLLLQLKTPQTITNNVNTLLALSNYYILKKGELKTDLDSAAFFLNKAEHLANEPKNEQLLGKCYFVKSKLFREKNEKDKGRGYAKLATDIFLKYSLKEDLADAYIETAAYYGIQPHSDLEEKIKLYQKAVLLYEQAGAIKKQAHELKYLGDCLYVNGEFTAAAKVVEQSLEISKSNNFESLEGHYDLLNVVYSHLGNYNKAIKYGLLAVKTVESVHDTSLLMCTIYNRLGNAYNGFKQYNLAREYFEKSLTVAIKCGDSSYIAQVTINLAVADINLKIPHEALKLLKGLEKNFKENNPQYLMILYTNIVFAYVQMEAYPQTKYYIDELIKLKKIVGHEYKIDKALILYYLGTKQFGKAYENCNLYEQYCSERKMVKLLSDVYLWRFEADSALGNFNSAIKNYQRYKLLEDSLYNENSSKQIAELSIEYETSKKDNDIKLKEQNIKLLTNQSQLKDAELKQTRLIRNAIIIGSVVLVLLLGLVFRQYVLKQNTNEQLLIKQKEINHKNESLEKLVEEKEWLVKEIHHRVKNNLQIVMSLLNTQSAYSENEQSFAAIRESRQRMYAMSLIHQKLYQTENMTLVNMTNYIPELVSFLKESFVDGDRIYFDLKIENIELDISQAVPVGLILNEAITNSIKYAFDDTVKGTIKISMNRGEDDNLVLVVKDNGKGLPEGFDLHKKGSMGIKLIETLGEQLEGDVIFKNDAGLAVIVRFRQQLLPEPLTNPVNTNI